MRTKRPNTKDYPDGKWNRLYARHLDEYIDYIEKENKELKDKIGVTIPVGGSVNLTVCN